MRWIFLVIVSLISPHGFGASCGTLDATYSIYTNDDLEIENTITVNGNSVSGDHSASGIEPDGDVVSSSPSFPALDPSSFPSNSSDTEVDSDDPAISSSTEVFYKKVEVKKNASMSIVGDGPYHIDELKLGQGGSLTFDGGVYYIKKFDIEKNGRIFVNSAVTIHIGEEMKVEQGFGANVGGDPADFVVLLHSDAEFEIKKNAVYSGTVYGDDNGDVKIEQGVQFTGSLVSDGKVEIEKNVSLTLNSSQQTSVENVSTCSTGGSGSAGSCDAIPVSFPAYSSAELKVDRRVEINGNRIDDEDFGADTGLNLDGSTTTGSVVLPDFDPTSFPANSASTDLDEDDSPLDGTSAVFYDTIDVGNDQTFTFTGAGPFHIDELRVRDRATVNFSAGTYFIRNLDARNDSLMTVEYPTRIFTSDQVNLRDRADLNPSGEPHDVIVFVYANAKFETGHDSVVVATVLGKSNEKVKLDNRTDFTGLIVSEGKIELKDDVEITLTSEQLTRIGQESTCADASPASSVSYFVIGHDGAGINCLGETFTVTAKDSAGETVTDFAEAVTVATQTSNGSFSLSSGNGTFADDTGGDGLMTYTFDAADSGVATFTLDYQQGTNSFDLDSFLTDDSAVRDDDTEGNLVFAPTGFTVTQSALRNPPPATINDPITTQTAGTAFNMHLAAYGQSPTDGTCGVIEDYAGTQNLSFWVDYANPVSGTLVPTVDSSAIASSEGAASAQSVVFNNGQASVQVRYKDVGQIQLEMKDGDIRGGSSAFVVRPADIVVTAVQDSGGSANPGASAMNGSGFVTAGEAFTVRVEVRDSQGSLTPNYGNETMPEGLRIASARLVAPAGGFNGSANDGAMGNGTNFSAVSPTGTFENTVTSWDETGIIRLQASVADGNYLGTGDVSGTLSGNVGRFTSASFILTSGTTSGSCSNRTYMGQPALGISYSIEARGAGSNVLRNYDTTLVGSSNLASLSVVAENNDAGTDLSSRMSEPASLWVNGVRTAASSIESFSRLASPDGPFANLQLGVSLTDELDGLSLSNLNMNPNTSGSCASAGNCNAVSLGSTTEIYYGRLEVQNSFGAETAALEVPIRATVYNSSNFVVNSADGCTTYQTSGVSLSNYQDGLPTVSVLSPSSATNLSSGVSVAGSGIFLSSPGATNTGSVDVTYNAPNWLEFDWLGSGLQDPFGTAIFGTFRGHDKVIYWREVY